MSTPADPLSLAVWRRQVMEMYTTIRQTAVADPVAAWRTFRAARDELFMSHPQSPLSVTQRASFSGLSYFDYNPDWRVVGRIDRDVDQETLQIELPAEGVFRYTRIAKLGFTVRNRIGRLSLFWIEGYGGGLFLPFQDETNGRETFGGGRYLYDTIKGADLGVKTDEFLLDFNYAYNPSCAYHSDWICPLPPPENKLPFAIEAGERRYV